MIISRGIPKIVFNLIFPGPSSHLGEEIVLGNCRRAISTESGETVWNAYDNEGTTLLTSCTILGKTGTDYFQAQDCINGTLLPQHILGKEPTNLTTLQNVFHTLSKYLYYISRCHYKCNCQSRSPIQDGPHSSSISV